MIIELNADEMGKMIIKSLLEEHPNLEYDNWMQFSLPQDRKWPDSAIVRIRFKNIEQAPGEGPFRQPGQ